MKCGFDQMSFRSNVVSIKCRFAQVSFPSSVISIKCRFDQMSFRSSVVSIKCRFAQVSFPSSVISIKCRFDQMSFRSSVVSIKCRSINCRVTGAEPWFAKIIFLFPFLETGLILSVARNNHLKTSLHRYEIKVTYFFAIV